MLLFLGVGTITHLLSELGGSQVLETTADSTVSEAFRVRVLQEIALVALLTIQAAEVQFREWSHC